MSRMEVSAGNKIELQSGGCAGGSKNPVMDCSPIGPTNSRGLNAIRYWLTSTTAWHFF